MLPAYSVKVIIDNVSWYIINYLFGALSSLVAGLFILYRGETRVSTRRTWFALCVSVSGWHLGRFLMTQAATEVVAQYATLIVYLGAILIPPTYLHFVLSLLTEEKRHLRLLVVAYAVALIEFFFYFNGSLLSGVRQYSYGGFYEIPGEFYLVYVASFVGLPIIAFAKLLDSFRRTDAVVKRNQLKYVIYSTVIGFVAGGMSFTPFFTSQVPPFGAPLVYFYTLPITYAVAQYRLMDISVVIKRSVIYAALLVGLLIPCFLVVIWGTATCL